MFEQLDAPRQDPILSLTVAFRNDPRPEKIDLGIGVYRNSEGVTPIMEAVRLAQQDLANTQTSKSYVGLAGDETFNQLLTDLLLSDTPAHARASAVQTPGASGALRMLADLIATAKPDATVWISDPSYVNHRPVMEAAGLTVRNYPYFNRDSKVVDEAAMLDQLKQLGPNDVVLLHGCCHNPTGADISIEAWKAIAGLVIERGFIPFVDLAYQGFGDGLSEDAAGLRLLAETVPELLIATSCSKNFGLYRERTGAAIIVGQTADHAQRARGRILELARSTYTMPPDHGAAIVAKILQNQDLRKTWLEELVQMNQRIKRLRQLLLGEFRARSDSQRFDYFGEHRGMFSVTSLSEDQTDRLKEEHGIYLVGGGRVNVAGMSEHNVPSVVEAFLKVGA